MDEWGPNTSAGKYWHPEGTYCELAPPDHWTWPLKRYLVALEDVDRLNLMLRLAHAELRSAKHRGDPGGYEKAQLRYGGLELLRDVDNEEGQDE